MAAASKRGMRTSSAPACRSPTAKPSGAAWYRGPVTRWGPRAVQPDPASHGGQRRQLVGHRGRARAHDALRPAGGPRRVQHRAAGRPVERERLVAGRREQAVELLPDLHHLDVESGHRLGGHGGVGRLGDQQPGAGVVDDVADLVGGQVPVHGGEPGAGEDGRGGDLDQLDPVAEQQGHGAAGRHAGLAEEASGPRGPVDELAAGAPPRQVVEGGRIGVRGGEVEQRHARIMSDWTGRPAARRSVRAGHGAHYVVAMAGGGHGTKAVVAALLANAGIAVAKFVGFLHHGVGARCWPRASTRWPTRATRRCCCSAAGRARRAPTAEHPFGYGRERYFWAFVVALILFSLGGMFAIYEGIEKIRHPHELESVHGRHRDPARRRSCSRRFSFRTAIVEARQVKDPQLSWWDVHPPLEAARAAGRAAGGPRRARRPRHRPQRDHRVAQSPATPVWDGIGTLCDRPAARRASPSMLAIEMKGLLIGESASRPTSRRSRPPSRSSPACKRLIHMRTEHIGPDELLVGAKIELVDGLSVAEVAEAVNRVETSVRRAVPMARIMYLEPDIFRTARAQRQHGATRLTGGGRRTARRRGESGRSTSSRRASRHPPAGADRRPAPRRQGPAGAARAGHPGAAQARRDVAARPGGAHRRLQPLPVPARAGPARAVGAGAQGHRRRARTCRPRR